MVLFSPLAFYWNGVTEIILTWDGSTHLPLSVGLQILKGPVSYGGWTNSVSHWTRIPECPVSAVCVLGTETILLFSERHRRCQEPQAQCASMVSVQEPVEEAWHSPRRAPPGEEGKEDRHSVVPTVIKHWARNCHWLSHLILMRNMVIIPLSILHIRKLTLQRGNKFSRVLEQGLVLGCLCPPSQSRSATSHNQAQNARPFLLTKATGN